MIAATYILFFLAVLCYMLGAGVVMHYLRRAADRRMLVLAGRVTLIGAVFLSLMLLLRLVQWRLLPLSDNIDVLSIFMIMTSAVALAVSYREKRRALLVFYLPPLALVAVATSFVAVPGLHERPDLMDLSQVLLVVHVLLIFFAYSMFFVASLTSAAYAYQANRLKERTPIGLFQKLPSLENLDRTLYGLIASGYPFFLVTMLLGLAWAYTQPNALSDNWWLSPKIFLSIYMVVLYGVSFHGRMRGLLRGPKLAHFVFIGFGVFLCMYLLLELLQVKDYNFFASAP